jgi:hypothetical protein
LTSKTTIDLAIGLAFFLIYGLGATGLVAATSSSSPKRSSYADLAGFSCFFYSFFYSFFGFSAFGFYSAFFPLALSTQCFNKSGVKLLTKLYQ